MEWINITIQERGFMDFKGKIVKSQCSNCKEYLRIPTTVWFDFEYCPYCGDKLDESITYNSSNCQKHFNKFMGYQRKSMRNK